MYYHARVLLMGATKYNWGIKRIPGDRPDRIYQTHLMDSLFSTHTRKNIPVDAHSHTKGSERNRTIGTELRIWWVFKWGITYYTHEKKILSHPGG